VASETRQSNAAFKVLLAGKLFDGIGDRASESMAILLHGSHIAAVGRQGEVRPPEGAAYEEWRFDSAFVLPGLIDAHTHVTLAADGRTYEQLMLDSDEVMALVGVRNLELHLRSGVTTLRDNGARNRIAFALKEGLRRGYIRGPRLLASGRSITCTGGHFHIVNAVADGPDELRREVRKLVHEGADFIKVMATGGGTAGTLPDYASYSEEELRVIVEEAKRFGKLTSAHTRAKAGMINAARAGIDCIEHAEFLEPGMVSHYDPKVAELLLKAGTYVSPTLEAGTGYHKNLQLKKKQEQEPLSAAEKALYESNQRRTEARLAILRRFLEDGFADRLISGTDAGCGELAFGHLQYDIELMTIGGMSNAQAIKSATSVAAKALGVDDVVGTISPGRKADILVVEGDPLSRISDLERVAAVIMDGERVV